MSISNSYPTQRPSLNLVFNGGSDQFLDSRISFSRPDTPPTYAAPSAVHYWSNEKSLNSENLLPYSNDLSNAAWTKSGVTTPSNNNASPDGGTSASSVLETATTGGHSFYDDFACVSGDSYTSVVYAKANGRSVLRVAIKATATIAAVDYDLTAVSSTVASGAADSHSISAIGSTGWYKLVLTVTATATGTGRARVYLHDGSSTSYSGIATKGAYIWGCQVSSTGQTVLSETSGSIHRSYAPTLKSVTTSGQPRFEYDPASDGQSVAKGLLIEQQKSNLALNSNDFTNATWNKQRVTVTPSAAIGPDGQLSASLIAENTDTTTIHFMLPTAAITSGYSVGSDKSTHSVFAKYAGRNLRMAEGYNSVDGGATIFDLQNGTVVSGGGSIQNCGNGWYRCSITVTMSASTLLLPYIQLVDGTTWPNASDAGDGYSGVLLFGLQTEQQSMSSYITTGGSTVSRAADSCSVATADFGFTGGPVSVYTDADAGAGNTPSIFSLSKNNTASDSIRLFRDLPSSTVSTNFRYFVKDGGVSVAQKTVSNSGSVTKFAVRSDTNNTAIKPSGITQFSDTVCTTPVIDTLEIGGGPGVGQLNGTIRNLMLWNVALSDTELAALVD